jgi:Glutaredoxin-like domain (DUF836)
MVESLRLYHTSGCHLCEKAKDLLWPLLSDYPMIITECDIAESDALIEIYGTRIPVLRSEAGAELAWPFDTADLVNFLQNHKIPPE